MREQISERYKRVETEVRDNAHKAWLFGLGTYSWVEEESKHLFDASGKFVEELMDRGKKVEAKGKKELGKAKKDAEKEAKSLRDRVEKGFEDVTEQVDKRVTEVLHRVGIPTRQEIHTLTRRVEELTARLEGKLGGTATVGRKVYHVVTADDGWKVELEGSKKPLSTHATKDEAVDAARTLAQTNEPSQVVVHRMDGTIQNNYSYDVAA